MIDSLRRRKELDYSHHYEVAVLDKRQVKGEYKNDQAKGLEKNLLGARSHDRTAKLLGVSPSTIQNARTIKTSVLNHSDLRVVSLHNFFVCLRPRQCLYTANW